MTKPQAGQASKAANPDDRISSVQFLEKQRLEWVNSIRDAALVHDIKIRKLEQKSPSFEVSGWRVNIEEKSKYGSAVLMWTAGGKVSPPPRHPNWIAVPPGDARQGWIYRRKLHPSDLHILILELLEGFVSEESYRTELERRVLRAMKMPVSERAEMSRAFSKSSPRYYEVKTRVFNRNPNVIADVRLRANGVCEACGESAPFRRRTDDTPYLEVHHRTPLADGGADSVENAIGLCPNCHRKAHFG